MLALSLHGGRDAGDWTDTLTFQLPQFRPI
jgi:hypothetical protein